jgi:DNA-directed RNA polymerase specialized sigma24 family protein
MKEFEFIGYVVPLRNRMFRYAQSLLLCADEAEEVTHDLLERLWTKGGAGLAWLSRAAVQSAGAYRQIYIMN